MNKTLREPLVHISRRDTLPWYKAWAIRAAAIVLAVIACGVITVLLTGENPIEVYAAMIDGNFGTSRRIWVLLQNVAMLLIVSLAVTPAFKMRFWNIGGEGQIMMGCLASAACMICLDGVVPNWLLYTYIYCIKRRRRRDLGPHPGLLQGQVEHQRDAVHPHDELRRHAAGGLLHHRLESPKGSGHVGILTPTPR